MEASEKSKRIAKNTLMLYFRMFFMMAIALYTSRINLDSLGVVNYGIYNAVGGIVAMFSIISGSLSLAIGRYLTYEIGKGNTRRLNVIFCTSVNIQIAMALLIMVIAEIAGVWFLNAKMNIPEGRIIAANWVFQCSILTFMINLISVPYNALIIAHEKMSAFAYISILEVVLKLLICYFLYISPIDKLVIYALLLTGVSILMRFVYGYYCNSHFQEVHYKPIVDRPLLKDMSKFIGWAFIGNGVVVLKDQGANILLNIFCGPIINAARGVAMQVNNAVNQLINNFLMAVNPQITKSYSGGDLDYMHNLIIRSGKFAFFILLLAFFPLWANIDFILHLWLVEVPAHTGNFILLIMGTAMLDCFGSPLVDGVLAEGNIRRYEINLTILYLANFLASYIFLRCGYEPEWVFILNLLFKFLVVGALLIQAYHLYGFPVKQFFFQSLLPSLVVFSLCAVFVDFIKLPITNGLLRLFTSSILICSFTLITIYFIGLTKEETVFIMEQIKKRFKRK